MKTSEALLLLEQQRLLPLTRVPGFECLVEAVAGAPVKGSWWGHPAGKRIFLVASELEDSADVLVIKILDDKVTFMHRGLFAALYRVVTDRAWRRARALDGDERFLSRAKSVHTASGKHETVLEPWSAWASEDVKREGKALAFAEAYEALVEAGRGRLTLPPR